jgi:regulator of sigma E protease
MPVVQSLITIVLFFLVLGLLVLVHELGHFLTARAAGVRVLEFGIGFPPRSRILGEGAVDPQDEAWDRRTREETIASLRAHNPDALEEFLDQEPERTTGTLYTLNWLPIGGFVKLGGEDGDDSRNPRSFSSKPLLTRLWILVAGVLMNVLLAFVIFAGIAWLASPYVGLTIGSVAPDSPAQAAGLQDGESIYALDGRRYQFLRGESVLLDLRDRAGETVTLTIVGADGAHRDVEVTLRAPEELSPTVGALGIQAGEQGWEPYWTNEYAQNDPVTALQTGWTQLTGALGLILGGLGTLVSSVASDPTAPPPVSGPVGIATQLGDIFWGAGPILTLYVAAILSANLAVVNILPFPPLDGGRMLMITLKSLFGARISLRAEQLTYMVGFVFLFAFIIWITGYDIMRGLTGGPTPTP